MSMKHTDELSRSDIPLNFENTSYYMKNTWPNSWNSFMYDKNMTKLVKFHIQLSYSSLI